MKKLISFIAVCLLTGCTSVCTPDGKSACIDDTSYKLEKNGELIIGVEQESYGMELVNLWNKHHKDQGNVSYVVIQDEAVMNEFLDTKKLPYDILWTQDSYVPTFMNHLWKMDEQLPSYFEVGLAENFSNTLNASSLYYIPMSAQGMLYGVNVNQLKEKQGTLKDTKTMEALMKLDKDHMYYLMEDLYAMYPLFTSSGWQIFADGNGDDPGFDQPEFKQSLINIKKFYKELKLENDPSHFDNYFIDQSYTSGLIGTWMQYEESEKASQIDLKFASMPTYAGKPLTPLAVSYGFVMSKDTKVPSMAHEMMRLIRSKEGMEVFANIADQIPLMDQASLSRVEFKDDNQKEMSKAFLSSFQTPFYGLKKNPQTQAMEVFYNSDILVNLKAYINGEQSVEKAQKNIVKASEKWMAAQARK